MRYEADPASLQEAWRFQKNIDAGSGWRGRLRLDVCDARCGKREDEEEEWQAASHLSPVDSVLRDRFLETWEIPAGAGGLGRQSATHEADK